VPSCTHARSRQHRANSDFGLTLAHNPTFVVPRVWLHSLVIHKLPAVEPEAGGTRLMVCIIANRSQFLYTSQAQGGGHVWVPCTDSGARSLCSVEVALFVPLKGEASLKVWHLAEQATVRHPRQLIFQTTINTAHIALDYKRARREPWCPPRRGWRGQVPVESRLLGKGHTARSLPTAVARRPEPQPPGPASGVAVAATVPVAMPNNHAAHERSRLRAEGTCAERAAPPNGLAQLWFASESGFSCCNDMVWVRPPLSVHVRVLGLYDDTEWRALMERVVETVDHPANPLAAADLYRLPLLPVDSRE